jgi:hypothetical protein
LVPAALDGLSGPPLNVLAFIQTERAPVLFQIHPGPCVSFSVRHNRRAAENKIAVLPVLTHEASPIKGGIYRHFESKQQLAAEAFDYAWKLAIDTRFEGTQEISNTVDRLKQIVRNFRDRRAGLAPGGCPLLNTAMDSDDGNPQLREKAQRALRSYFKTLRKTIMKQAI